MAEMLIQSENLVAIANKIRVLSGTEDTMGLNDMENHVGEANENVATEADLITQIADALEGKAGGSNGNGIDVCTVIIHLPNDSIEAGALIDFSSRFNGKIISQRYNNTNGNVNSVEFRDIVQNTMMFIYHPSGALSYPPKVTGDVVVVVGNSQFSILRIAGNAKIDFT